MATVKVEPTDEKPFPYSAEDETTKSFFDELHVAGNTAETLVALGAPLELDRDENRATMRRTVKDLLRHSIERSDGGPLRQIDVALGAAQFLDHYGKELALDVAKARAAVTNKLLEIAGCGDTKYELKALELLGKHSDIGLFTERSEITIRHQDADSLEEAIKGRLKRILHAEIIDVSPKTIDLDEELGVAPYALRMRDEVQAQTKEQTEEQDTDEE